MSVCVLIFLCVSLYSRVYYISLVIEVGKGRFSDHADTHEQPGGGGGTDGRAVHDAHPEGTLRVGR